MCFILTLQVGTPFQVQALLGLAAPWNWQAVYLGHLCHLQMLLMRPCTDSATYPQNNDICHSAQLVVFQKPHGTTAA